MREAQKLGVAGEIDFRGHLSHPETMELLRCAWVAIVPSESYETFGRVAMEAFACGVPVIAADIGALGEIVRNGHTGWHFKPGDWASLARVVREVWDNAEERERRGDEARREFERLFTPERNYELVMEIYEAALSRGANRLPANRS